MPIWLLVMEATFIAEVILTAGLFFVWANISLARLGDRLSSRRPGLVCARLLGKVLAICAWEAFQLGLAWFTFLPKLYVDAKSILFLDL